MGSDHCSLDLIRSSHADNMILRAQPGLATQVVLLLCSLSLAESITLADFLYQRLSKYRIGGEKNIFQAALDDNDVVTGTGAGVPSPSSGVLVLPDQDTQDITVGASMTLEHEPHSLHLASKPVTYIPKPQNVTQYGKDQDH